MARSVTKAAEPVARGNGLAAIMRSARDIFAERGYHGASIRDIAKGAGLSLSVLYYYYSSKQELLYALLDETLADYLHGCEKELATAAADDPAARLAAFVRATVGYRVRRQVESHLALREMRHLEPDVLERFVERRNQVPRLLRAIIDDGVARGVFATPYPDDAQRAILAMCNAIAQWYQPSGGLTVHDLVERYERFALTLVEHRPPQAKPRAGRTRSRTT